MERPLFVPSWFYGYHRVNERRLYVLWFLTMLIEHGRPMPDRAE
jgi:hypothetical protein